MKRIAIVVVTVSVLACVVFAGWKLSSRKSQSIGTEIVKTSWVAPKSNLPHDYVAAAESALGNGLGDPRGGVFCKITLADKQSIHYGWILADQKTEVRIDGAQCPIEGQTEPVHLEEVLSHPAKTAIGGTPFTAATPALLLLVGKTSLAESQYEQIVTHRGPNSADLLYGDLAEAYQGLTSKAAEKENDADGLQAASFMVRVLKLKGQANLGSKTPGQVWQTDPNQEKDQLERASNIYADFKRRVENPRKEPVDLAAIAKLDKPSRIAALIDALDTVSARQFSVPGGPSFFDLPIYKALVAEGSDAVPALLDTMENDKRFTRTVAHRGMINDPGVMVYVHGVAYSVLEGIWPSSYPYFNRDYSASAKAMREAWKTVGKLSEPERWLGILVDDKTEHNNWERAGEFLVKPSDQTMLSQGVTIGPAQPGAPMTAEPIRATRGAEITNLLTKRVADLAVPDTTHGTQIFSDLTALKLAHCLAKWEPSKALPSLKVATKKAIDDSAKDPRSIETLGPACGVAIADRLTLKDDTAISDLKGLASAFDTNTGFVQPGFFKPFTVLPNDPRILAVGESFMARWGDGFASSDLHVAERTVNTTTGLLPSSALLAFKPYRQLLVKGLEVSTPLGSVKVVTSGGKKWEAYQIPGISGGNWTPKDSLLAPYSAGKATAFSVGDFLAQQLSTGFIKEVPDFLPVWPREKRAAGRKQIIDWLSDDHMDWIGVAKSSPFYKFNETQ